MLVRNRMSRKVISAEPEWSLDEARKLLERQGIRQMPVVRGERVVGIVTDRDLRGAPARAKVVRDVMSANPVTVTPDLSVDEAARLLRRHKFGALPVLEGKRLAGILTVADVLDAFVDLSGVEEPTYRLVLTPVDGRWTEAEIRHLVADKHGELKWLHRDTKRRPSQVHLRLKSRRVDDIVTSLEAAGFDVVSIVAPGRKR